MHSSDPAQTVVDTSCLDGDNSWQQKQLVNLGMDAGLLGQGASAEPVQSLQECGKFEVIVVSGLRRHILKLRALTTKQEGSTGQQNIYIYI